MIRGVPARIRRLVDDRRTADTSTHMFGFKKSSSTPAQDSGEQAKPGFFARLRDKLNRGNSWLTKDLRDLLPGGKIDDAVLDELEMRLIGADVGVETTERIL